MITRILITTDHYIYYLALTEFLKNLFTREWNPSSKKKTSYVRHNMALGKGIQRNTRYLTLSVEFNQIWMQGPFLVVFSLTWKKLLIQLITVSLFINWTFTVFGGLSMFGLDLIYKIEHKLQLLINGRLTSLLLRMGSPRLCTWTFTFSSVRQWYILQLKQT